MYAPLARRLILRAHRGQEEAATETTLPVYDPSCYLCPGNRRAAGDSNPQYESTLVFVNDYSAVKEVQADYKSADTDGSTLRMLLSRVAPDSDRHRSFINLPTSGVCHRQMLCRNFLAVSQPDSCRSYSPCNSPCYQDLD